MQVATGKVIGGRIVLEGTSLPEGAMVTVFAANAETTIRLSSAESAELESALADADHEEGITAKELFERLEKYG
jgi:hypothetical protein